MKIVFCSMPYVKTEGPVMAPAVLKAVAEKEGHQSWGLDLNIDFVNQIEYYPQKSEITNYLMNQVWPSTAVFEYLSDIIDQFINRVLALNPDVVGLSLLTYQSQIFTYWFTSRLKDVKPDIQIIIGGSGIKKFIADNNNSYCEDLKQLGLIDHYIMGDGELALVEYLRGNLSYNGIDTNTWIQATNQQLESHPYPKYEDYNFDLYRKKEIPIVDSRGCVRTCEFCDIIEHWTKFAFRSGESIFDEMLVQSKKYGIRHFYFKDSLINGNMKVFTRLVELIAEHNRASAEEEKFSWQAYFIIRNSKQHPESLFELIKESRGDLELGIESVIRNVRWGMGKKFENEDIDWHLEMGQKYQIPLSLLLIIAYPTETLADWEFTKQWFKDRVQYGQNPVYQVQLNWASILPNTTLERKNKEYGFEIGKFPSIWFDTNFKITTQMKIDYINELNDVCKPFFAGDLHHILKEFQASAMNVVTSYSEDL